MAAKKQIRVRATVNLAGLAVGTLAIVDPSDQFIAVLLKSGLLVRVGGGD